MGRLKNYLGFLLPTAAIIALCLETNEAISAAQDGITLCLTRVIPSLFPFLIFTALLSASSLPSFLAGLAKPLSGKRFPYLAVGCFPFLTGVLGGYPAGVTAAAVMYDQKKISARSLPELLLFCQNTGPALLLSAAGVGFLSKKEAILIWFCHVLAAITTGRILCSRKGNRETLSSVSLSPHSPSLPHAMKQSFSSLSAICGYVVLFSVILSLAQIPRIAFFLSCHTKGISADVWKCFLSGFTELSSGIFSLPPGEPEWVIGALAAFFLGWGGICVHLQTVTLLDSRPYSLPRYLLSKFMQGILTVCFYLVLHQLFRHGFPFIALANSRKYW